MKRNIKLLLTGACGKIAHSLYGLLLNGVVFPEDIEIDLNLLDVSSKKQQLKMLKQQLEDCCFANVKSISVFNQTDQYQPFSDIDYGIFLGGMPRIPGMARNQVYEINAQIFKQQGQYLNNHAKKTCISLVVANPACTNCMILAANAPTIPKSNFTALTRLDFNRFIVQIAKLFNCRSNQISNVILWGNHSRKQYCDVNNMKVLGRQPQYIKQKVKQLNFPKIEQIMYERGGFILEKIQGSANMAATKAITDHLKDLLRGNNQIVSMGVIISNNEYGLPNGLCYSLPVRCIGNAKYQIINDIELNEYQRRRIDQNKDELIKQKNLVSSFVFSQ